MKVGAFTVLDGVCVPYRFPHRPANTCTTSCNVRPPGSSGTWDAYENTVTISHMRMRLAEQKAEITRLRWANIERSQLDRLKETS